MAIVTKETIEALRDLGLDDSEILEIIRAQSKSLPDANTKCKESEVAKMRKAIEADLVRRMRPELDAVTDEFLRRERIKRMAERALAAKPKPTGKQSMRPGSWFPSKAEIRAWANRRH